MQAQDGLPYFSDSGEIPLSNDKLNVLLYMNFMWTVRLGAPNSGCLVMTPEGHGRKAKKKIFLDTPGISVTSGELLFSNEEN